ncbi:grpb/dephospho-CoA kinase [Aspergillus unguis]
MISPSSIINPIPYYPDDVERVSRRSQKRIEIVDPDPNWPAAFGILEARIRSALPGDKLLYLEHVGSTSVPGLPAKDVIDIDVIVLDPTAEETYVPALESVGFQFLHREPKWHQHRFFGCREPYANLHVFGPDSPEVVRHRLFRDWLRDPEHAEDRKLYASVKKEAANKSQDEGETLQEYTDRKDPVIRGILRKIYEAHGFLEQGSNDT